MSRPTVAVFGAYGHTGRFIVTELRKRGFGIVLAGRDAAKLDALQASNPEASVRVASVDDAGSLDRALAGAGAVINGAGPFAFTAGPMIEAAIRARIPYLDVAAEIEANLDTFEQYGRRAREAGIAVLPAVAFFGGLGDLLATAALGDWAGADEIRIAYGLDRWKPTAGTLAAGSVSSARRNGRRLVYADGSLEYRTDAAPRTTWPFPEPLGSQTVVAEFTMADTVTISRHIRAPHIRSYMTASAIEDLVSAYSGPPVSTGSDPRSSQRFLVDVIVRSGAAERRASASGRDIYAFSAPLIVEALERLLRQPPAPGVYCAGELFEARDFLRSLSPEHLDIEFSTRRAASPELGAPGYVLSSSGETSNTWMTLPERAWGASDSIVPVAEKI